MSRSIPTCKNWRVRCPEAELDVLIVAPTKLLARLNTRHEFPKSYGKQLIISLYKGIVPTKGMT